MIETDFISKFSTENVTLNPGVATWQSPSNIALIKYWGKSSPQIPKNSSVSFTLNNCHTLTSLKYSPKSNNEILFDFKIYVNNKPKPEFAPKIEGFFKRIAHYVPFIKDLSFEINTRNSFPHSSGIASSASGLSALALCLMSIEKELDPQLSDSFFYRKASFLARLGSGSASRSIEGPLVVWGHHSQIKESSDLYGVVYPERYTRFSKLIKIPYYS